MSRLPLVSVDNSAERYSRTQRWYARTRRIPRVLYVVSRAGTDTTGTSTHSAWTDMYPSWDVRLRGRDSFMRKSPGRPFYAAVFEHMWRTGGVFVDGDALEPLRPIDPLLSDLESFVACDAVGHVSRSIFGATARHAVLRKLIDAIEVVSTFASQTKRNVSDSEFETSMAATLMSFAQEEASKAPLTFRSFATHLFFPNTSTDMVRLAFTFHRDAASVAFFFKNMLALRLSQNENRRLRNWFTSRNS